MKKNHKLIGELFVNFFWQNHPNGQYHQLPLLENIFYFVLYYLLYRTFPKDPTFFEINNVCVIWFKKKKKKRNRKTRCLNFLNAHFRSSTSKGGIIKFYKMDEILQLLISFFSWVRVKVFKCVHGFELNSRQSCITKCIKV